MGSEMCIRDSTTTALTQRLDQVEQGLSLTQSLYSPSPATPSPTEWTRVLERLTYLESQLNGAPPPESHSSWTSHLGGPALGQPPPPHQPVDEMSAMRSPGFSTSPTSFTGDPALGQSPTTQPTANIELSEGTIPNPFTRPSTHSSNFFPQPERRSRSRATPIALKQLSQP